MKAKIRKWTKTPVTTISRAPLHQVKQGSKAWSICILTPVRADSANETVSTEFITDNCIHCTSTKGSNRTVVAGRDTKNGWTYEQENTAFNQPCPATLILAPQFLFVSNPHTSSPASLRQPEAGICNNRWLSLECKTLEAKKMTSSPGQETNKWRVKQLHHPFSRTQIHYSQRNEVYDEQEALTGSGAEAEEAQLVGPEGEGRHLVAARIDEPSKRNQILSSPPR
jgi:hypothetical protein